MDIGGIIGDVVEGVTGGEGGLNPLGFAGELLDALQGDGDAGDLVQIAQLAALFL